MNTRQHVHAHIRLASCLLAVGIVALMLLFRQALEARMAWHMLCQFPMLILAGWLLAPALPAGLRRLIASYNQIGLAGFTLAATVVSLWMIPLALDLAVSDRSTDLYKFASLLAAGLALRLSWALAAKPLQAFFLIGWGMMTATAGLLYQEAPVRLCNSYLADEQVITGTGLIIVATAIVIIWFAFALNDKTAPRSHAMRPIP
ncbi:hypothetical protein [Chitinimonas naiadis]